MIRSFDRETRRFAPVEGALVGAWLDVFAPDEREIERLVTELGIPRAFIDHALDADELARLDREGDRTLAMLEVPRRGAPDARVPFTSEPLGVVLRPGQIVTIAIAESEVVSLLAAREAPAVERPVRLLLELIFAASEAFLVHLRTINREVALVEERLEHALQNREVLELLRYQKALVYFTTALEQNDLMLERLRRDAEYRVGEEDQPLLDDVIVEIRQARDMTTVAVNILSETMDAFASIISNNLNVVMKVLTALTLVVTLPSLIVGAWGMNVALPLQDHPLAFLALVGASLVVSAALLVLFRRKRWL